MICIIVSHRPTTVEKRQQRDLYQMRRALTLSRTMFSLSSMLHPVDSWWSSKRAIWDTYLVSIPQQRSMLQTNIWRRQEVSSGRNILCAHCHLNQLRLYVILDSMLAPSLPKTTADFGLRNFARSTSIGLPVWYTGKYKEYMYFWDFCSFETAENTALRQVLVCKNLTYNFRRNFNHELQLPSAHHLRKMGLFRDHRQGSE